MKNLSTKIGRTLSLLFIASVVFTSLSCNEDEPVDCEKIGDNVSTIYGEVQDADCSEIDAAIDRFNNNLRKGKSCDLVKNMIADLEVENVEGLVAYFADDFAEIKSINCPQNR